MRASLFARLLLLLAIPFTIACATPVASAAGVNVFNACNGNASKTQVCKEVGDNAGPNPIIHGLKITIAILATIIGITAVIVIIISGLSLVTAAGDAQAVAKARSSIIYALVGLVIAGLAGTIVAFVLNKL